MPGKLNDLVPDLCVELEWDSTFFGCKIGSIVASSLDQNQMQGIVDWAAASQIDCLYFLADPTAHLMRLAEKHGFQLMDLRVTLVRKLDKDIPESNQPSAAVVRPARTADIPALRDIAASSHTDSRFYQDPNFPRGLCNELYSTWIERSCNGFADMVLVAELNQQPAGYIACHFPAGGAGRIGLVGVASNFRNAGVGQSLVAHALRLFSARAVESVTVVTQGSNIAAQRLYQRNGFLTQSLQLWYHRWFGNRTTQC